MRTSTASRKSVVGDKRPKAGSGSAVAFAAKLREKWQFAPDAIGMVDGPGDLSRRKGLNARSREILFLDRTKFPTNLPPMKANRKVSAPKRTRAPKSGKFLLNGKKPRSWVGFAPELCGVMSGPSDLSLREGFARG